MSLPVIRPEALDLSSPWAFLVVVLLALVDGVFPLVPARTAVIGLGVLAADDPRAYSLIALATAAAFLSDNISYWIGRRYWPRLRPRLFRGPRAQRLWGWVDDQMARHGLVLVALARIVPGGPTPITLTAGATRIPRRRFCAAAAVSSALWSLYALAVGLFGGAVTGGNLLRGFLAAVLLAGVLNLLLRWALRRRRDASGGSPP